MAGEKKGKAYEAFVKVALERLTRGRSIKGTIFWNKKADGITIEPDLTIGADENSPQISLLVHHSGSAGDSHKKFWRNIGELCESKIVLNSNPRRYILMFDSIVKEDLKLAQAASFDGQLIVGDLGYGTKLQNWMDHNLNRIPKDKEKKVTFLEFEAKIDKTLRTFLNSFTRDLDKLLKQKAPAELNSLWKRERKRQSNRKTRVPRTRNTFVRRGLSKLLIFEDVNVALNLFSGKRVKTHQIPIYAFD